MRMRAREGNGAVQYEWETEVKVTAGSDDDIRRLMRRLLAPEPRGYPLTDWEVDRQAGQADR